MTQKLIESLEFSRGAGGRWCIYQVVELSLIIILVFIYKCGDCNQYVQLWGIWTRFEEDDVRTIGTFRSISCTLGVPHPPQHGSETLPDTKLFQKKSYAWLFVRWQGHYIFIKPARWERYGFYWQTELPQWEGGRLFDGSARFFYGNSCNSGTESRKIVSKVGN